MKSLIYLVLAVACVNAATDEEMKADLIKLMITCMPDHPIEVADMMMLKNMKLPKKPEVYCLLACTYRKQGLLNAKGLYDLEQGYKLSVQAASGDQQRLENGKKLSDTCVKVNEIAVKDGEKGCERAGLIFQCSLDNAGKFGFKL